MAGTKLEQRHSQSPSFKEKYDRGNVEQWTLRQPGACYTTIMWKYNHHILEVWMPSEVPYIRC